MLLLIVNNSVHELFLNVSITLKPYLCMFVTNCKEERLFSKLKLIVNYLKNSIVKKRLASLAVLWIESYIERHQRDIDFFFVKFLQKTKQDAIAFEFSTESFLIVTYFIIISLFLCKIDCFQRKNLQTNINQIALSTKIQPSPAHSFEALDISLPDPEVPKTVTSQAMKLIKPKILTLGGARFM